MNGAARDRALIVAVDDDADILELVVLRLEQGGHEVISARDGETGMKLIKERRPDLAILDVRMPGLSGYEVTRLLKAEADTRDVPILLLSASVRQEHIDRAMESGADGFLGKPFRGVELRDRVNELLAGETPNLA